MIILPELYKHCSLLIKDALHHLHYGLGRQYKIQIFKGFEHEIYGDAVKTGNAVMFTIQQMQGSMHLKENNDIRQVKEWFNQSTQGVNIHVVDNKKYDIFVIAKRDIIKQKAVEAVKDAEGHVLEYKEQIPMPEWNAIDATGLAENTEDGTV